MAEERCWGCGVFAQVEAERDRFREALERIAEDPDGFWGMAASIAREALMANLAWASTEEERDA